MADQPKPPLWRVMFDAAAPHNPPRKKCSAMICALTDWLVPEEIEPDVNPAYGLGMVEDLEWDRWHSRHQLRQLLLTEAKRAEAGE